MKLNACCMVKTEECARWSPKWDMDMRTQNIMFLAHINKPNSPLYVRIELCYRDIIWTSNRVRSNEFALNSLSCACTVVPMHRKRSTQLTWISFLMRFISSKFHQMIRVIVCPPKRKPNETPCTTYNRYRLTKHTGKPCNWMFAWRTRRDVQNWERPEQWRS